MQTEKHRFFSLVFWAEWLLNKWTSGKLCFQFFFTSLYSKRYRTLHIGDGGYLRIFHQFPHYEKCLLKLERSLPLSKVAKGQLCRIWRGKAKGEAQKILEKCFMDVRKKLHKKSMFFSTTFYYTILPSVTTSHYGIFEIRSNLGNKYSTTLSAV